MNFDFSPDQRLFQEQVRRSLDRVCPLAETRRVFEDDNAAYSNAAWSALCELGVPAAPIPEVYGGLGHRYYELCLAAQEVGRALAPTPLRSSIYLAAEAIMSAGSEEQKARWLPPLAAGQLIATIADSAAPDSGRPAVVEGRFTGRVPLVANARSAGLAVILASEPTGQPSLYLVSTENGVTMRALTTIDPSCDYGELYFEDVAAERLGPSGHGNSILKTVRVTAAVLFAFEQVGGAERCLEMARDYALQRMVFGRRLASHQAIKHKLAEVYTRIELARAHAQYAVWALSSGASDVLLAAAAARVAATDAFSFAAQENIQTHGGIGFTWEADPQLFYRRARLLALELGGPLEWKERVMSELEGASGQMAEGSARYGSR